MSLHIVDPDAAPGPLAPPPLVCDANGEILVEDIIRTINELIQDCEDLEDCCKDMQARSHILTERVGNTLYITDDGTPPR